MKLRYIILVLLASASLQVSGQDFHNSYFQFAPLNVNPALTGAFYGNLRASVIGRDQGRSVAGAGNEFQDLSLALDGSIDFGLTEGDWVSAGMNLAKGRAGDLDFTRNFTGIAVAYHLAYGKRKNRILSLGVKYGKYFTSGFDIANADSPLTLSQVDPSMPDQDILGLASSQSVPGSDNNNNKPSDYTIGLMLTTPMSKTTDLRLGLAVDHLLQPQLDDSIDTMAAMLRTEELQRRFNVFVSYYSMINKKLTFNPNLLVQSMDGTTVVLLQGLFNYVFDPVKDISFNFGIGLRPSNSMDIPLFIGVDIESLRVGLSYDTNVTGLSRSNGSFGALELGISKVFSWEKKTVIKPVFVCPRL